MSYTSGTVSDRLDAVRSAIDRCLNSQDYTLRGRRNRLAELRDLRVLEKELQEELSASSAGPASLAMVIPAN